MAKKKKTAAKKPTPADKTTRPARRQTFAEWMKDRGWKFSENRGNPQAGD